MIAEQISQCGGLGHNIFSYSDSAVVLRHFARGAVELEVSAGEEDGLAVDHGFYAAAIAVINEGCG